MNELEEKFVRMPGPNLVKRSITQLPLVQLQICLDGANAPMVSRITQKVTREYNYWSEHTENYSELELRKKLHKAFNLVGPLLMEGDGGV